MRMASCYTRYMYKKSIVLARTVGQLPVCLLSQIEFFSICMQTNTISVIEIWGIPEPPEEICLDSISWKYIYIL